MQHPFRLMVVLLLAITCVLVQVGTTAGASFPNRAVLVGTSDTEFNTWGVWVSRADGSDPVQISVDGEGSEPESPILSPDGLQIAFLRFNFSFEEQCIEVTAVDGGRAVPVYCGNFPQGITWSPDGYHLAFTDDTATTDGHGVFILNLKTQEVKLVADLEGHQVDPTFSPTGQKLAFETTFNDNEEFEPGIWIVNANATEMQQLTDGWEAQPAWSPDGSQIAAYAVPEVEEPEEPEEEEPYDEGAIVLLNSSTGAVEKWLMAENFAYDYDPNWTTDGEAITFTRKIEEGPFEGEEETYKIVSVKPDGTEETFLMPFNFFWAEGFRPQQASELVPAASDLLKRYEPRLHFDQQEQYFADSAAEATDNETNRILDSKGETVLAAHEEPFPTPSLSLLAEPEVANGVIDLGPEYAEDAANMHALPQYANQAYGRIFHDSETGRDWLDYWYYYYYNNQEVAGIGVHEGDWERVSLRLDDEGVPDVALYSRHGSESAACEASAVEWEVTDGYTVSPRTYVANASHANYFWSGEHERPFPLPHDDAYGDGAVLTPGIQAVQSAPHTSTTAQPRWFYWNGTWGASGSSPGGPARSGSEWEDLQAYAESKVENCDAEGLGEAPALRAAPPGASAGEPSLPEPLTPTIKARMSGQKIQIRFELPKAGPDAKHLLLSVSSKDRPDATRTGTIEIQSRRGVAYLPRPLGPAPYVAAASTFTGRGERSDTRAMDVKE
jgi:hypothetical protein